VNTCDDQCKLLAWRCKTRICHTNYPLALTSKLAERHKRVFNIDIALFPIGGGTMRIIANITVPEIIQKILDHIEAQPPPPNKPVTAIQS